MNLISGWENIRGQILTPGVSVVLAFVGAAIILISVLGWLWQKRRGGGGGVGGFPWIATVLGAVLAGPSVLVPAILGILQVVITLFVNLITWAAGLF